MLTAAVVSPMRLARPPRAGPRRSIQPLTDRAGAARAACTWHTRRRGSAARQGAATAATGSIPRSRAVIGCRPRARRRQFYVPDLERESTGAASVSLSLPVRVEDVGTPAIAQRVDLAGRRDLTHGLQGGPPPTATGASAPSAPGAGGPRRVALAELQGGGGGRGRPGRRPARPWRRPRAGNGTAERPSPGASAWQRWPAQGVRNPRPSRRRPPRYSRWAPASSPWRVGARPLRSARLWPSATASPPIMPFIGGRCATAGG